MTHICPRDSSELVLQEQPEPGIYRCERCYGLWVPASLVAAHLGMPEQIPALPSAGEHPSAGIVCPEDGGTLLKYLHQGVELDVCAHCRGVWLDRGELEYIKAKLAGTAPNVPAAESLTIASIRSATGDAANTAVNMAGNVAAAMIPATPDVIAVAIDVGTHAVAAAATNPQVVEAATEAAGAVLSGVASAAPHILEGAADLTPGILGAVFELIGGLFSN